MIPSGRLVTFYGDDFSGSTDVMEVLAANGLETVLFLDVPQERQLERFPNCRAIGIAGCSRSQSPAWMTANLPRIFRSLQKLRRHCAITKPVPLLIAHPKWGVSEERWRSGRRSLVRLTYPWSWVLRPCAAIVCSGTSSPQWMVKRIAWTGILRCRAIP